MSESYFGTGECAVDAGKKKKNRFQFSTLDLLISPLRQDIQYELWSIKEIALFESGICKFGKNFSMIKSLIPTKSVSETVEFFYMWKKTSHYRTWKSKTMEKRLADQNEWIFTK